MHCFTSGFSRATSACLVTELCSCVSFTCSNSVSLLVHYCFLVFVLISAASGCQFCELYALLRRQGFCSFGPKGQFVHLQLAPSFLAMNEWVGFQSSPLDVVARLVRPGMHHVLSLVVALCHYLCAINSTLVNVVG